MKTRHRDQFFVLFILLSFALAFVVAMPKTSARAEMTVTSTTSDSVKTGDTITESTKFSIEKDAEVQILKVDEGTTHILKGPFKGTLKQYESRTADCSDWWDRLTEDCETKEDPLGLGGMRGVAPPRDQPEPAPVGGTRGIR